MKICYCVKSIFNETVRPLKVTTDAKMNIAFFAKVHCFCIPFFPVGVYVLAQTTHLLGFFTTKQRNYCLKLRTKVPQKPKLIKIIITTGKAFQRQKTRNTALNRVVDFYCASQARVHKSLLPGMTLIKEAIIVAFIKNLTSFDEGKCLLEVTLPFATGPPQ